MNWSHWKPALVGCALAAYAAAYAANITTGRLIVVANDAAVRPDGSYDLDRSWVGEDYRCGANLAHIVFAPANMVDRMLRPGVWGRYDP
jgi:hypothetical protein